MQQTVIESVPSILGEHYVCKHAIIEFKDNQMQFDSEQRLRAGSSWHNEYNMIFTRANGMFVRFKTLYIHFKDIVKDIGRPEVRFHDVRHTYATLSLQSHVDPKTLSEALGHATVAFTLDVYGHSNSDMRQQAADQLEALICQY